MNVYDKVMILFEQRDPQQQPITVRSITAGNYTKHDDDELTFEKVNGMKVVRLRNRVDGQVTTMTRREVYDILREIQAMAFPLSKHHSDHRLVLQDVQWKRLYQHGQRKLKYIQYNAVVDGPEEETFPCKNCGIVLPIKLIQVDHQAPRGVLGGPFEAIAKVFRAFGYTQEGPKGLKGKAFPGAWKGWGDMPKDRILPIPRQPSVRINDYYVKQRYTLNGKGKILLSLVRTAGLDCYEDFEALCVNSRLNLAPLCSHCNTVIKRGKLKCP
jgi:hypothetical protein